MFLYSDPKLKMQRNLRSPLAVQRLRLRFHCKGHGFDPWWGCYGLICFSAAVKKKKKKERNLDFISQLYLNKTKEKIKKEFLILLISHTIITKYFYK